MLPARALNLLLLLLVSGSASAMSIPAVPTGPIYYEPPVQELTEAIRQSSCYELDSAIRHLHPYRYSYKPDYYQDNTNKLAAAVIVMDTVPILNFLLGMGYLGYSSLVEEKEARRMLQVEEKIAMLQRAKAEKYCFQ